MSPPSRSFMRHTSVCLVAVMVLLAFPLPIAADVKQAEGPCPLTLLKNRDYYPALVNAINKAKIEIVMSFFLFKTNGRSGSCPDDIVASLIRAAQRGIRVEILLERGNRSDAEVDRENSATAQRLKGGGVAVCFDSPKRTTHAKFVVIDRRYVFLGSHNLTQSALRYNNEVSVMIDSESLALESRRYIKSLCPKEVP